jgi:hypothetical protein
LLEADAGNLTTQRGRTPGPLERTGRRRGRAFRGRYEA